MLLKPESITMVATDGHRLAHCERAGEKFDGVSGEMKTLVPKKAMDELKSLLDSTDAETIEFAKDESTLFFRIGSRLLTSRQLTGQFPNFEAVLPKDNSKIVPLNCRRTECRDSSRGPVCRRALARRPPAPGKGRSKDLRVVHRSRRVRGFPRSSLQRRAADDRLQRRIPGGFPEGRRHQRSAPGVERFRSPPGQLRPAEGDDYKYRYIVMPMRI